EEVKEYEIEVTEARKRFADVLNTAAYEGGRVIIASLAGGAARPGGASRARGRRAGRRTGQAGEPSGDRAYEVGGGGEHFGFAVAVRGVAGAGEEERLGAAAQAALDGFDLGHRAVLVRSALDEQRRGGDRRKATREVPAAEAGVQPGSVPAPERRVDVVVPARQARAQIAFLVGLARLGDALQRKLLGEDVRRFEHQAAHRLRRRRREGDRGSVAVAEEDRLADAGGAQDLGEEQGFVVHVADGARQGRGGR